MTDFSLPESWLHEADTQRRVAKQFREEADMYKKRYWEAKQEGTHDQAELAALCLSMWHCIEKAATIEREIRGLGA